MQNSLYPSIVPFNEDKLQVSELHTLHYEQVGNPNGQTALFLHGGPGLGILPVYRRFFDPKQYTQATSKRLLQSYHSASSTRYTCEGMLVTF